MHVLELIHIPEDTACSPPHASLPRPGVERERELLSLLLQPPASLPKSPTMSIISKIRRGAKQSQQRFEESKRRTAIAPKPSYKKKEEKKRKPEIVHSETHEDSLVLFEPFSF